jgi:Zn-dependent M28 family amino/carboxypeptidase
MPFRRRASNIVIGGLLALLVAPSIAMAQGFTIFIPLVSSPEVDSAVTTSAVGVNTEVLRAAVSVAEIRAHQNAFQAIADANGGTRVSGFPGYDASAAYVADLLQDAGYVVSEQEFEFPYFQLVSSSFEQIAPNPTTYTLFDFATSTGDYDVMTYSGSGSVVNAEVVATNDVIIPFPAAANTSTSGCEAEDFEDTVGKVALIQRGTCTFADKAINAQAAGAVAVLIFNEGQPDLDRAGVVLGQLGAPGLVTIPVIGISYALGVELAEAEGVRVSIAVDTVSEVRETRNILAETVGGRTDRVVLVGAHLDSVPEGPGINDNGSGAATILEIALELQELGISPRNQVRFAFWGAEEFGLLGSEFYVANLSKRDIKNIAVNLNFDMVGSPNYIRFVYDGNGSDTPLAGPNGSANVEKIFLDYFARQNLPVMATAFDGRSDYGPFIAVGIPAGGLFTGAEGIKTAEEAAIYGGTAGVAYDPCYHQACDTFANTSEQALDEMSDAAAHAILTFAMTKSSVNGTAKASKVSAKSLPFDGSKLQK